MGSTSNQEKAPKKSRLQTLKSEFKKIIWPDKKSVAKSTVAVVAISIFLSVLISILDSIIQFGVDFLVK